MKNTETQKQQILDLPKQFQGIQAILQRGADIIGNPIVLFDISYKLIAHSRNTVTDDFLWNELTTNKCFSFKTIDLFNQEGFISVFSKSSSTTYLHSDKIKYDRINGAIYDKNGVQLGDICVVSCYKEFEENDHELIEALCEVLADELEKSKIIKQMPRIEQKTLLNELLDNDKLDYNNKRKITNEYNLKSNEYLYVAVVDLIQYEATATHLNYFCSLFKSLQSNHKYYIYSDYIIIIMKSQQAFFNESKELKILTKFISDYQIYVGVSECYQNIFETKKYLKQAISALNYGLSLGNDKHIFKYDYLKQELFLNSLPQTNFRELCNPLIFSMLDYDKENNTQYADILYNYLLCGLNSRMAAQKLGLDYSILCSSIKQIWKLFGIDRNDGNVLFSIFRSFKLLKIFSEKININP